MPETTFSKGPNSIRGSLILKLSSDIKREGCELINKKFPDIDILINNAGIFSPKPIFEISDDEWLNYFNINVLVVGDSPKVRAAAVKLPVSMILINTLKSSRLRSTIDDTLS
ncbi:SDR family NAD(P)-dependent oxidoreductase [Xenorhabdus sp. XENO-2]|uniref:SDR family NAD(P)-dependent oxidoreductase n=1 Tax=Xenorhabdus anantnagensis TaxID=3025875 RepID=A0ABT5LUI4_9GAMM|nr:SDR family NAD(P)-dependent oxidoreductase [Xenorhabdus anantnagensis]MDC9597518.1 SDR family NAD(P)-dependent oxidoreductase [Xenorhabdus anantnagensis]